MEMTHNTAGESPVRDRINSAGLAREARSNRLTSVNAEEKIIWMQQTDESLSFVRKLYLVYILGKFPPRTDLLKCKMSEW